MSKKLLLVTSNYYENVSNNLTEGAIEVIKENDLKFEIIQAPGCFEIPFLIKKNIDLFDGFVALGCIIRGETYHFDLIANECARKIMDISISHLKPIGFGILTCENLDQALIRSDKNKKNKGKEAALACIKLVR